MTFADVAKRVFTSQCVSACPEIVIGDLPAAILTDGGTPVRLAILDHQPASQSETHYVAPFTTTGFRSMMGVDDPIFFGLSNTPARVGNLEANESERVALCTFAEDVVGNFAYRVFDPLPNLHPEPKELVGLQAEVRCLIETVPLTLRSSLIDLLAPQLWALAHRESHRDFMIISCYASPEEKDKGSGYIQCKGCGNRLDPFGRRWIYAESESFHQKEHDGQDVREGHADIARLLGWRSHAHIGNDFGLFILDGPVQAAMLAEMFVDTLINLHGLEPLGWIDVTLTAFESGASLTSSIQIPS